MAENPNTINIITGHTFGGILSVYETLVPFLKEHFYINIITLNKNFGYNDPFFPGNTKISLEVNPPINGFMAFKFIYKFVITSFKYNLKNYIVNNSSTAILIYLSSFFINVNFFIHQHEPISSIINKKRGIKKRAFIFFLNKTYRKSLGTICISKSVQEDMKRFFPRIKTKLIYNPIPVSTISKCTKINPFISENISNCIFVSVGRLTEAKDYYTLIEACANLQLREILNYTVYIIGDGDEYKSLKLFIEKKNLNKNIYLIGFKENPIQYIKYCDCYLSTSKWEGFGLTIAYAMYLCKPVIASKTGGAQEILHENNMLFEIGNSIALSKLMEQFIKTRKYDKIVIQQNYERAQNFAPNRVSSEYIKYIKEQIQ